MGALLTVLILAYLMYYAIGILGGMFQKRRAKEVAEEKARQEKIDAAREKQESEERARKDAEEKARQEILKAAREKQESEERARKDAEEKARQERVLNCISWAKELGIQLNSEQALAVCSREDKNWLVTARAGSGKTRVLTTRATWLIENCDVDPSELLLLAFNKKAQEEMEKRLKSQLGERTPHVMTFHALAYRLVRPKEKILYDNHEAGQYELTEQVMNLVYEDLSSAVKDLSERPHLKEEIFKLITQRYRDVWSHILREEEDFEEKKMFTAKKIVIDGDNKSLDGTYLKSGGEKLISNVLFENNVKYEYEPYFEWDGTRYNPDFAIKTGDDSGVVIEYFGMNTPEYNDQRLKKRGFWKEKENWKLIEFEPTDITRSGEMAFSMHLLEKLSDLGIEHRPLTDEEIERKLPTVLLRNEFIEAYTSFIVRCRRSKISNGDLSELISKHKFEDREEELFLTVVEQIYKDYLEEIIGGVQGNEVYEDFSGLIWRAVNKLTQHESIFESPSHRGDLKNIRHVLIDEFQDFSEQFYALLEASKTVNSSFRTFAVGDDWQAINGFAGSDLKFFKEFDNHFKNSSNLSLRKNYRSRKPIVDVSNALMENTENPDETVSLSGIAVSEEGGQARIWHLNEFINTPSEDISHGTDNFKAALLRLIKFNFDKDRNVVILSRTNSIKGLKLSQYKKELLKYFLPEERRELTVSTTHKYKGLEKEVVIVLDPGRYPLIHPHWKFQSIFGDSEEQITDAERRLFYVALSRAEIVMDVLVDKWEPPSKKEGTGDNDQSTLYKDQNFPIFLEGIRRKFTEYEWKALPPIEYKGPNKKLVRVSGAFKVKNFLISGGYTFQENGQYWFKAFPSQNLEDPTVFEDEHWFDPPVQVQIFETNGDIFWKRKAMRS